MDSPKQIQHWTSARAGWLLVHQPPAQPAQKGNPSRAGSWHLLTSEAGSPTTAGEVFETQLLLTRVKVQKQKEGCLRVTHFKPEGLT